MDTKALRQKILDLAIHGKLVPQDPNDEPASVLLERIRAEKERLIKEGKIKKGKKSAKTSDKPHYPFELPKGWVWCRLEDVTSVIGDGLHGTPQYNPNGAYYFVNGNNLSNRQIIIKNNTKRVSEEEYMKYKKPLNEHTILVSINGTIGNIGTYSNEQIILGKSACYFNITPFLVKEYMCYVIESNYFQKYALLSATGSTIKNVPLKAINEFYVPIPPVSEQKRIVSEIDYLLAFINKVEEGRENLQNTVQSAKFKILGLAIHGKLVLQDPNDEPASELLKRINPKAEITCDNPQYGKLPKGWCETHIGDAFKVTMGQSPDGSSLNPIDGMEFHQGKILFGNKYLRKSSVLTNSPTKIADADTLLLCVRAPVGVVNITKQRICIGRGLCCLTPTKAINLDYAFYMLTTFQEKFESQSTGSTFKAISGSIIKNEQLWLPPLSEQHRIVAKIEELFAQLDKIEASL